MKSVLALVVVAAGLMSCAFVPAFAADLFFAGDSTLESCWVDGRKREPYRSWGDSLQRKLKGGSKVRNFARSGYSTKMFIERGAWKSLIAEVKAGDFVVIQFGHNDQKHTTEEQVRTLYAPPDGAYRENLRKFAAEVRAKGATPVFCTPIVRATFDDAGRKLVDFGTFGQSDAGWLGWVDAENTRQEIQVQTAFFVMASPSGPGCALGDWSTMRCGL